jgi:hypothetical protein
MFFCAFQEIVLIHGLAAQLPLQRDCICRHAADATPSIDCARNARPSKCLILLLLFEVDRDSRCALLEGGRVPAP